MALAVTAMLFSHIMLHLHECCRMAPLSKPHGHCIAHQHAALCCVKWQLRSLQPSDLMAWWVKGSLVFSEAPQALWCAARGQVKLGVLPQAASLSPGIQS